MTRMLKVAMVLALTLGSLPVQAQVVKQEIQVGVYGVDGPKSGGERPAARPEEYGELKRGPVLEKYAVEVDLPDYVVEMKAENVNLNNRSFKMEGGKPGVSMWKASYDQMPHLLDNNARSLYTHTGGGNMRLGGTAQADLQASFEPTIRQMVNGAPYVDLGFDVKTTQAAMRLHPTHDLKIELGGWRQTRVGTKAQPASFGFSNAIELAAPMDMETNEGFLNMQYAKKAFQMAFNYRVSDFVNHFPKYFWDNPKRATENYTAANKYSAGDSSVNGQMANAPDNRAHAFKLEGGVNLPLRSRFGFEAGYQLWTAKNTMLPYTTNTQMNPGNATAAAAGLTFDASAQSNRPDPNVEGKIEVYTYMGKLVSRPFDWLRGSLQHESYIMENKSKQYALPGWAVFDQVWHNEAGGAKTPREEFRDDKTSLKLDYDIASWLSGNFGASHKFMKKTRAIPLSREDEVSAGFTVRPSRRLWMNLGYLVALRRSNGADIQHYPRTNGALRSYYTEAPGMRRVDVADRNRNQGRVQVQWMPGEASVNLSARYTHDGYRASKHDDLTGGDPAVWGGLFGILKDQTQAYALDASVPLGEKWDVDVFYEHDFSKRILRSVQTAAENTYFAGGNTTFIMLQDPARRWETRMTDTTNAVGLGFTWRAAKKVKTKFGYDMILTRYNGEPVSVGSAITNYRGFQTSRRVQQTVKLNTEYKVRDDLTLGMNYFFDKFMGNDFAYDGLPVRLGTSSLFLGANPIRNYYVHSIGGGVNYKF